MANSSNLRKHLNPKGNRNDPNQLPNVLDSDGNVVLYNQGKWITTESTAVDIGDAPNSNSGDPLRTAFTKINNFIEASYWTNDGVNSEISRVEKHGPFLGVKKYNELDSDTKLTNTTTSIVVLGEDLTKNSRVEWLRDYPRIPEIGVPVIENQLFLPKGSILQWNSTAKNFKVVYVNSSKSQTFNFGQAITRLSSGTQNSSLTKEQQLNLYAQYNNTEAGINSSIDLKSRNIEDAIVEMHARYSQRGFDSGYYD